MKPLNTMIVSTTKTAAMAMMLAFSSAAFCDVSSQIIDSFDNSTQTSGGIDRVFISDTTAGGQTSTKFNVVGGVITLKGDIAPPRGQPGWSSMVLPLGAMGKVHDASQFSGIRLTVKVNHGNISISANSADVKNYDYHAAQVAVPVDGKFHRIDIPFDSMKRIWSQQTALNTKTLDSLSIVAFGLKKSAYDFSVNDVSFY